MLFRVRYRHLPIDQTARTYWTDARSALALAMRFVKDGEPEVMLESDGGGVWTPEQFKAQHG